MQDTTNNTRYIGQHKGTNLSKIPSQNTIDKTRDPRRKSVSLDPFSSEESKIVKVERHWNKLSALHRLQITGFLREKTLTFLSISQEVYEKKSQAEKDELEVYIMEMVNETRQKVCERFHRSANTNYFSGFNDKKIEHFIDIPRAYWENVLNERILRHKKLDFLMSSIRQSPIQKDPVVSYSMEIESKIVVVIKMVISEKHTIRFVSEKYYKTCMTQLIKDSVPSVVEIDLSKNWYLFKYIQNDQNLEDSEGLSVIQFTHENLLRNGNNVTVTFPNGLKIAGCYETYDKYYIPFELSLIGNIFKKDGKYYMKVSRHYGIKR